MLKHLISRPDQTSIQGTSFEAALTLKEARIYV
jgi:hypothetical protein